MTNSEIQNIGTGISYINSDQVLISDNNLHNLQSDAMHGGGTSDITITHNTFSDFAGVGHPDAIQFWTTGSAVAAHDITISDNTITRGSGAVVQGVFMGGDNASLRVPERHNYRQRHGRHYVQRHRSSEREQRQSRE